MNYKPFEDRKHLLRCALIAAIDWEISRIDAGVCDNDQEELASTKAQIKAYQRYLRTIDSKSTSFVEEMAQEFEGAQTVGLLELKEMHEKSTKGLETDDK